MSSLDATWRRIQFVSLVLFLVSSGVTLVFGLWCIWTDADIYGARGKLLGSAVLVMSVSALAASAARVAEGVRSRDPD
jgi:hypothetical protein